MKFSLFFCTAVFVPLIAVSACSEDQSNKPATIAEAVGKAAQATIDAPVAQSVVQAVPVPVAVDLLAAPGKMIDCAAPAKAVDGVCLHPQLKRVNGRDDDCSISAKCRELFGKWEKSVGATHPLFR